MHENHRMLLPEEIPVAAALVVDAFHAGYQGLLTPAALAAMSSEYLLGHWLTAPDLHLIGLFLEHELVGVARIGALPEEPTKGHLFSLYIDPRHQGRGLGRYMLEIATAELRQAGFTEATLWVFERNARANTLYQDAGWAPTGKKRIEPQWGEGQIELRRTLVEQ
jgi:ribosomal protein S18 acetylase RimI-like enzyme